MGMISNFFIKQVANKRLPDKIIGGYETPYVLRWHMFKKDWLSGYLHKFKRSDDARALHDHPASSMSLIIKGGYIEWLEVKDKEGKVLYHTYKVRKPFRPIFRKATTMHRIQLYCDPVNGREQEVWTLFFFFRRWRNWGFRCGQRWVPWQVFCDPANPGEIGRGCS